jgi:hypothetical protein
VCVQIISSYDQLDALLRNPPSNIIVINAHGETVPMPESWGTSWQPYYDQLASDVSSHGWTFVSIAGYPLFWTISPIQPNPPSPGQDGLSRFLSGVGGQATTAWSSATGDLTPAGSQAADYFGLSFPLTQPFSRAVSWQGVSPVVVFYDGSSSVGASAVRMGNGYFAAIGLPDTASDQLKADMGLAFSRMIQAQGPCVGFAVVRGLGDYIYYGSDVAGSWSGHTHKTTLDDGSNYSATRL